MKKIFLSFLFLLPLLYARDIHPVAIFTVNGFVNDFVAEENRLFIATDRGTVDIFDLTTMSLIYQIVLESVENGRGEKVPVRILSVDVHGGHILINGIVENGFRAVWLFDNLRLIPIVEASDRLIIKEARFSEKGHMVLGTFGSELIRYSIEERAPLYNKQPADMAIGDMAMSADRKHVMMSDESGAVRIIHAESGRVVRLLPSKHLDNVFHVAMGGKVIVTGGNDRKVGVFRERGNYVIRTDFPVYCVGISPKGRTGVYLKGDAQILQLFDVETGRETDRLVGHEAVVNQIRFLDEKRILSSEKGPSVYLWNLSR